MFFTNNRVGQTIRNKVCLIQEMGFLTANLFNPEPRQQTFQKDASTYFFGYFGTSPENQDHQRDKLNLQMDGIYFEKFCIVVYQDDLDGYTQLTRFTDEEQIKSENDKLFWKEGLALWHERHEEWLYMEYSG